MLRWLTWLLLTSLSHYSTHLIHPNPTTGTSHIHPACRQGLQRLMMLEKDLGDCAEFLPLWDPHASCSQCQLQCRGAHVSSGVPRVSEEDSFLLNGQEEKPWSILFVTATGKD